MVLGMSLKWACAQVHWAPSTTAPHPAPFFSSLFEAVQAEIRALQSFRLTHKVMFCVQEHLIRCYRMPPMPFALCGTLGLENRMPPPRPHNRVLCTYHVHNNRQFIGDGLGSQLHHAKDTWERRAADISLAPARPFPPASSHEFSRLHTHRSGSCLSHRPTIQCIA